MPSKRGGGGASTSTSTSFTPFSDLVPASIPYSDQARGVLETLRAGGDPGIDALLGALNCGGACEAAGALYSAKCGCRAAFAAAAAGGGGAGGGAAPRCVRGLAPPPGSHRKVGLWAKPPKAEEEQEEEEAGKGEEAKEGEEEDEEERTVPAGLFNLGATCYVAGALQCLFADPAFRRGLYNATSEEEAGGGGGENGGGGGGDNDGASRQPADAAADAAGPSSSAPAGDAAVRALRRLFASMQAGGRGRASGGRGGRASSSVSADPTPLVRALGLDAGEQQDGQEFFKLLLALLEERLQPAGTGGGGRSSTETICGLCQGRAPSSDRVEGFTELAVPVRGSETLEAALAAAAAPEFLPGGDKGDAYIHCDRCGNPRAPATRRAVLHDLPPRLCISLQRFVFDLREMARAKVGDRMSFPLRLSAAAVRGGGGGRVGGESGAGGGSGGGGGDGGGKGKQQQKKEGGGGGGDGDGKEAGGGGEGADDEGDYELAAILIHKGASAHHGHYVAHVALPASGKSNKRLRRKKSGAGGGAAEQQQLEWWRFDDEGVSPLEGGPAGRAGAADHGVAAATAAAAAAAAAKKKKENKKKPAAKKKNPAAKGGGKRARGGSGEDEPIVVDGSSDDDDGGDNDAPILLPSPSSPRITSTNAYMLLYRRVGTETGVSTSSDDDGEEVPLPEDLRRWLREDAAAARASEAAEAEAAAAARVVTERRRAAVRRCLEAAPVRDDPIPEDARWVPARWFAEWCGANNVPAEEEKEKKKNGGGENQGDEDDSAVAVAAAAAAALENDEDQDPNALPPFPPCDVSRGVFCGAHGRVDPLRLGRLKLLSAAAWEEVRRDVGDCVDSSSSSSFSSRGASSSSLPPLAGELCRECSRLALEQSAAAAASSRAAAAAVGAVEAAGGPDRAPRAGDRWVSRHWYAAWLRRRRLSAASAAAAAGASKATTAKLKSPTAASARADLLDAAGPTAAVTCRHGRLLPARRCVGAARRSAVPDEVFELMLADYEERWGSFKKDQRKEEGKGEEEEEKKKRRKRKKKRSVVDCGDNGVVEISEDDSDDNSDDGSDDSDDEDSDPCRVAASATVSRFLVLDSGDGDGGDGHDDDGGCEECASAAAGGAAAFAAAKSRAERERAAAPSLAPPPGSSAATAPMPSSRLRFGESGDGGGGEGETTMALLPREWLQRWRAFVSLATRRGSSSGDGGGGDGPPPSSLAEAIKELYCSCHPSAPHGPRLGAPPPRLEQKRGKWGVAAANAPAAVAAVTVAAADATGGAGAGGPASSSSSQFLPLSSPWEVVPAEAAAALASLYGSPDLPTVRFVRGGGGAAGGAAGGAGAELVPSPPVCGEAVAARAAAALDASLCYSEGTLQLEVCRPEDVAPGSSSAAAAAAASKLAAVGQRARRGRAAVEASARDSLWTVKLRAFEHLGVHPRNADVYALRPRKRGTTENGGAKKEEAATDASPPPPALVATAAFAAAASKNASDVAWTLLEGDQLTLRELRVPDGALLRFVDAGRVDGSDLSFVDGGFGGGAAAGNGGAGGGKKGRGAPERGFAGTALFGGGGGGIGGVGEAKKQKREGTEEEGERMDQA